MKKKATRSLAMLIVQTASIFLAIIVIGALIQYIDTTKEQGKSIPESTLRMAGTGLVVKDVTGFSIDDNTSDIEGMIITVSPEAGSDQIDLEKSQIYIMVGNRTARLHIINGTNENMKSGGYYTE